MSEFCLTIAAAVKFSGLTRSRLYALMGDGLLDSRKAGRRTIIMADSLRRYLENLPAANIGKPKTPD